MTRFTNLDVSTQAGMKALMRVFYLLALASVTTAGVFVYFGATRGWLQDPSVTTTADKFAFAFENFALIGVVLWTTVFWVSNIRATPNSEKWQEAHRPSPGSALDMAQRITLNTLEQAVIVAMAQLALASVLPPEYIHVTRLLAVVWIVGRIAFTIGYRIHPFYRSFGMSMTFAPSAGSFLYAVYHILFA